MRRPITITPRLRSECHRVPIHVVFVGGVRSGEFWTSTSHYSFKSITQANVVDAWRKAGNVARECDFTLAQVCSADEAFVTGTLGGVTPVTRVDGQLIADGKPGPMTKEASDLYLRPVGAL